MNLQEGIDFVELVKDRRWCYFIPAAQYDDNGYIPSIVVEGVAGHFPLAGNGVGSSPWYWGKTLDEAEQTARAKNEELGVSLQAEGNIVMSSMRASNVK